MELRGAAISGRDTHDVGARIDGDLDLTGARLSHPDGEALHLNRTVVRGGLFLRGGAEIKGALDLTGASVDTLHDDEASWPAPGNLLLNRCLYNALIGGPMDARRRLAWLARQSPERWGEDFWPQPYEQLAHVFREMGHDEDARTVLVEKERLQRAARRARASSPVWRMLLHAKDGLLGVTLGYGRQPLLSFAWLLLFWGLGVVVFAFAQAQSAIKPNSPFVLALDGMDDVRRGGGRGADACRGPGHRARAHPGNRSSTASSPSLRHRAIPHSMRGCIPSTRCFRFWKSARRNIGGPIRPNAGARLRWAISIFRPSSAGR